MWLFSWHVMYSLTFICFLSTIFFPCQIHFHDPSLTLQKGLWRTLGKTFKVFYTTILFPCLDKMFPVTYFTFLIMIYIIIVPWLMSWRREESLPAFKRRLLGGLLDFAAREFQVQVHIVFNHYWFTFIYVMAWYLFVWWCSFPQSYLVLHVSTHLEK